MTIKRFMTLPVLLSGLLALCFLIAPAVCNDGAKVPGSGNGGPSLWAQVSWAEGEVCAHAEGIPGAPLELSVTVVTLGGSEPFSAHVTLPGVFDVNGEFVAGVPLTQLLQWADFDIIVSVASAGSNGVLAQSGAWGLRKRTFDPSHPNAPMAPSGGSGLVPAPGTQAPLLPYTWASMSHQSNIVLLGEEEGS